MYPALQVVAFETTRAPVGFNVKYPQSTPGQCQPHRLLGTGAWGIDFPFLTDARYGFTRLVTDVLLVSDQALDEAEKLRFRLGSSVGLTSLTALYTALKMISDQQLTDQHFLLIFYDRGEKYDWIAWEAVHE
jgi:cysteine synthase